MSEKKPKRVGRQGVPITVYLPTDQALRLSEISQERHVTKATVVRYAVNKLIVDLSNGQLELPLGLVESK